MLIDYWARFGATPLFHGLQWAIGISLLFYAVTVRINQRTVTGTHRAYLSATIIKTMIWPIFAGYVFCTVMDLFTQNWIGVPFDAWGCWLMLQEWERRKDNDDWWKGKGTKLKKKFRSLFTVSSPATAGAGA